MRGLIASNRTIVSQLLASFEVLSDRNKVDKASVGEDGATFLPVLVRYISRRSLHVYCALALMVAGCIAGNFNVLVGVAVLPLAGAALYVYLRTKEARWQASIDRDIPILLTSVASSVRAGIDPIRAMCDAEEYFLAQSPLAGEIKRFKQSLAVGDDEFEALESFFVKEGNRDIELFKRCIILSRRHGSSLAEPIHRVMRVVRQRQSFRRKTKAALAMHRMSAIGIAMCAVVITAMQLVMNYAGVQIALTNPLGLVLLCSGISLIGIGVVWMLMMGKEEKL